MKTYKFIFILIALSSMLIISSCGKDDSTPDTEGTVETTEQAVEGTAEEMTEAAAEGFDAIKDQFVETAQATVDTWTTQVGDLIARKEALPDLAQKPLEEPMKNLTDAKDDLVNKFSDLTGSTEENFEENKTNFTKSVDVVKDTYNSVLSLF